jgi:hypothetical protein
MTVNVINILHIETDDIDRIESIYRVLRGRNTDLDFNRVIPPELTKLDGDDEDLWRGIHWGTESNAFNVTHYYNGFASPYCLEYRFETKNSAPYPIIFVLSKVFREVEFVFTAKCDVFGNKMVFKDGEISKYMNLEWVETNEYDHILIDLEDAGLVKLKGDELS